MDNDFDSHQAKIRELHTARQATVVPITGKAAEILDHLDEGEPFFVFRAQDILSSLALDEYAKFVEKFNPDSPQLASLVDSINDFREWQVANPGKVKLPD